MKKLLILAFFCQSIFARAQNLPSCDSLVINCCTFDSLGPNTLTIYASNYSSNLFDYPGFVLFNAAMDTIAKETVNYFGISLGPQPHTLDIVAPLILPFNGYLNLYTLFYVEKDCSFPFYIPDTINSVHDSQNSNAIKIYPNPAANTVTIEMEGFTAGNDLSVGIFDMMGREVKRCRLERPTMELQLLEMNEGVYFVRMAGNGNVIPFTYKLTITRDIF